MPIEQTPAQQARDVYLQKFLKGAFGQFQKPLSFPDFSTVPSQSQATQDAQRLLLERAFGGSPYDTLAGRTLSATARGDYLDPTANPSYQGLVDRITGDVGGAVNARFADSGRAGSQANSEAAARGITDALAPVLFQSFQNERGNQLNAARTLPAISQLDFLNLNQAGQVGQQLDARKAALLQDRLDRFNFAQNEPINRLSLLGSRLGIQPSQAGIFEPQTQNSFLQTAGTLLSGAGGLNELFGADSLFGGSSGIFNGQNIFSGIFG